MPESVSTVDAILDGLRDATRWTWPTVLHGPPSRDPSKDGRVEMVPLDDAVAAVHAAAGLGSPDERLREAMTADAIAAAVMEWDRWPYRATTDKRPAMRAAIAAALDTAALAAADREAPNEPKETTT